MSTNPDPTTTYRHNICGSMADRHDSGPGIIRCGDMPLHIKHSSDLVEFRKLRDQITDREIIFAHLLVLQDTAYTVKHLGEDCQEET